MPVFDLSTGKVMHIPRGKSLVQKFHPKTGKQEYHYEDGWGNRYDVPKFEDAPKKTREIMKAMKAHFDSKDSENPEDSKNSGNVKEIQEDSGNSKNSKNSKDDVKTSEDVKKVDSEDSKDSEDVKSSDSEILENSEDVKKTSDFEGPEDSGDSASEYTDSEGAEEFDAVLKMCEEFYANEGCELVKVKDVHNLKVFEISNEKSKNEKAKISKNRAPITIFDHILIFTLLFVFAGIVTVTGYSDDVFKWIHEKTGVSWQTFGGKNWIQ